jgi:hypothetical protein
MLIIGVHYPFSEGETAAKRAGEAIVAAARRRKEAAMMGRRVEDPASAPSTTRLAKLLFGESVPLR